MVVALMTAFVVIFMPNYYRSEAKILPTESKGLGSQGQLAAAAAIVGMGLPGQDSADANFADILNSRSLRESLLDTEFQFREKSWRFGIERPMRLTLLSYLGAGNRDRAVRQLGSMIVISRDLKSKIITVAVETKSPELSQQIVQKALRYLGMFVMEKGRSKGGEKARFAEERLKDSRQAMAEAEGAFRKFLEVNRNYQTSPDPLVRLGGNRLEAELKLRQQIVLNLALNREQALLEEKNDIPVVNILDEANLPIDKNRPSRSVTVVVAFFLAFACPWGWLNREWIRTSLMDAEDRASTTPGGEVP